MIGEFQQRSQSYERHVSETLRHREYMIVSTRTPRKVVGQETGLHLARPLEHGPCYVVLTMDAAGQHEMHCDLRMKGTVPTALHDHCDGAYKQYCQVPDEPQRINTESCRSTI